MSGVLIRDCRQETQLQLQLDGSEVQGEVEGHEGDGEGKGEGEGEGEGGGINEFRRSARIRGDAFTATDAKPAKPTKPAKVAKATKAAKAPANAAAPSGTMKHNMITSDSEPGLDEASASTTTAAAVAVTITITAAVAAYQGAVSTLSEEHRAAVERLAITEARTRKLSADIQAAETGIAAKRAEIADRVAALHRTEEEARRITLERLQATRCVKCGVVWCGVVWFFVVFCGVMILQYYSQTLSHFSVMLCVEEKHVAFLLAY